MDGASGEVKSAMEAVSTVTEETSAAAEETSASTEEMSAQVEEVVASAQTLADMARSLEKAVEVFKVENNNDSEVRVISPADVPAIDERSAPDLDELSGEAAA